MRVSAKWPNPFLALACFVFIALAIWDCIALFLAFAFAICYSIVWSMMLILLVVCVLEYSITACNYVIQHCAKAYRARG